MASSDLELVELQTIRKLLILGLLQSGMTQAQLAAALGIHRTSIGRMFPKGALAEPNKKGKSRPLSEDKSDE